MTAALELADQRRIEEISVTDLVRCAGVSRQTFYNHFRDRDDAVYWAVRQALEERLALIERDSPPEHPSKRDNEMISAQLFLWLREHEGLIRNLYPSTAHQCLVDYTRDIARISAEAALDRVPGEMSPILREWSLRYIIGGSLGVLWEHGGQPMPSLSVEELVELQEAVFPTTVLTPKLPRDDSTG
jgi:AcrR family transcriptional regulator